MPPPLDHLEAQYWLAQLNMSGFHDETIIHSCVYRLTKIVSGSACSISTRELPNDQLYTLLSDRWLSDEHINTCGLFITQKLQPESPTQIVSSYFVTELEKNRRTHSTWTPNKPRPLDHLIRSGAVHTVIFPIHTPGHWTTLVVYPVKQTYSYTDTLDLSETDAPSHVIGQIEWWISSLTGLPCSLAPSP